MSSVLNPLHPGTLFIQRKLGTQFTASLQFIMPPSSALTLAMAPPTGMVWISVISTSSPTRDVATNNPIVSPLLIVYFRHSMVRGAIQSVSLDSFYNFPWPLQVDLKVNDPLIGTVTNGTALTLQFNITIAIIEITEDKYDLYQRLWNGVYNFELILGGLKDSDVDSLVWLLKTLRPVVPLPVPAPTQEVITHPTLHEDVGRPIKRIEIP